MPTIDILVPIFNHAEFLFQALQSCFSQSKPASSVVAVDDGSTQHEVGSVLKYFESKHANFRCIRLSENQGISRAQNIGVAASTADFIAFLDCDDFLALRAIEVVSKHLNPETDYLFTDRIELLDNGSSRAVHYGGRPDLVGLGSTSNHLLNDMVASHLKVIRRETIDSVGGFDPSFDGIQDWVLALQVREFAKFKYLPEYLYFHRVHRTQFSSRKRVEAIQKTNIARRRVLDSSFRSNRSPQQNRAVEKVLQNYKILEALSSGYKEIFPILGIDDSGVRLMPFTKYFEKNLLQMGDCEALLLLDPVNLDPLLLQSIWAIPERPSLGCVITRGNDSRVLSGFAWWNSFFDFVILGSAYLLPSLRDQCHPDLVISVVED